MGFIVKLLESGNYFIGDEGEIITTSSREEAISEGQFEEYEEAKETAEYWSKQVVLGVNYIIESV
ncbi:hypothetical protein A1E89_RS00800 [Acinetobacter baumannii]|uniref:hypothetical protein n=1 Tax=Acinetobacter TaxID=469 RepID=UPI000426C2E1|nr:MULTISPECIES: hypothetical protein [Acinetobacter]AUM25547.1 hypothetical protein BVD86_00825 [Acinetobacter pittii]EHU1905452.1 hypothetical protein [Acinetobacter baumannii]EIY0852858.1 hypothetical protein [Acinetobacter baumannii]EKV2731458.1 hypothetical protein [Acinetobacter baumannii]KAF6711409.1 hypothetical protein G9371_01090 [Acinetobacter sp. EKM10A]